MYIIERLPCRPSECFHLHPLAVYDAPLVPSFPYFFNQRDHITNTTDTDEDDKTVRTFRIVGSVVIWVAGIARIKR